MSLRQFVWWESPGNGRRGFFPHTQTGEDSKKMDLRKWDCCFCVYSQFLYKHISNCNIFVPVSRVKAC